MALGRDTFEPTAPPSPPSDTAEPQKKKSYVRLPELAMSMGPTPQSLESVANKDWRTIAREVQEQEFEWTMEKARAERLKEWKLRWEANIYRTWY